MSEHLPFLLTFYLAFMAGVLSPGPNILSIIGASMGTSRRAGVLVACGVSTGTIVWSSLAVTGVTALMASYAPIATALRIAGGAYLLWLAYGFVRKAASPTGVTVDARSAEGSALGWYFRGLAVQLTNPKAVLSWLALVAIVAKPDAPLWVSLAMVGGCTTIALVAHVGWALLFSTRRVVAAYDRAAVVVNGTLATLFGAIGAALLWDGIGEARS